MRILLAIDDSNDSRAATESVSDRPWPEESIVGVLSVIRPYLPIFGEFATEAALRSYQRLEQELAATAQTAVDRSLAILGSGRFVVEPMVRRGEPRSTIVDVAKEWGADLIVVGSHGRTGLRHLFLGSVAEYVVRHAPCSVEVSRRVAA
jgi:nucleotide-binding universal stress UspA family protein